MVACTTTLVGNNEYIVAIESLDENATFEKEYIMSSNPLELTNTCNYGEFNKNGIFCGRNIVENPRLDGMI
jgi:hypothetical protein